MQFYVLWDLSLGPFLMLDQAPFISIDFSSYLAVAESGVFDVSLFSDEIEIELVLTTV